MALDARRHLRVKGSHQPAAHLDDEGVDPSLFEVLGALYSDIAAADDGRFFDIAFFYPALYRLGVAETSQREYSRQIRPREGRAVRLRAVGYQQLVVALSISFPAGLDRY
ncbi:hypothetical protein SDC9_201507 [bioreactor metagenome]|uniref:Uncharacterized protein n=1 Tax=bioreactor metagenome TaxID=1076179 RepID=A0A645ITW2_9ZZZZ